LTGDLPVRVTARQHTDLTQHPVAVLTNTITVLQPARADGAVQTAELISVTIRDRSREAPWGVGPTAPVIRTVTISAFCPGCGARRGERSWLTTFDDGERYWTETWSCSARCGHIDHYANVVTEADRRASARPTGTPAAPTTGTH
jgi:hypothetical protein